MIPSNFHTHTTYCHGENTPEELIKRAIELSCEDIGFTSHSYTFFDESYCMSKENTKLYIEEIKKLKEKYKGKINVYLGVEQDYFSDMPTDDYDYVIGSVHYVYKDGHYLSIDYTEQIQMQIADKYYGGDYYALVEDYYKCVGNLYNKTKCNIIGHFDLITKFNEDNKHFDINSQRYLTAQNNALKSLLSAPVKFEVNYGAVINGIKKEPYPEKNVLEKIKEAKKDILYTTDCHKKEFLIKYLPEYKNFYK